jgi:hypothetical protein
MPAREAFGWRDGRKQQLGTDGAFCGGRSGLASKKAGPERCPVPKPANERGSAKVNVLPGGICGSRPFNSGKLTIRQAEFSPMSAGSGIIKIKTTSICFTAINSTL